MKKLIIAIIPGLFVFSSQVFADGAGDEHQAGLNVNVYVSIGAAMLFALFLILYYVTSSESKKLTNVKKQEDRAKRSKLTKRANSFKWMWITSLAASVIFGGISLFGNATKESPSNVLQHIHGLGFSGDGKKITIPAHDGIRVYSDGRWSVPEGAKHDYMGYSVIDDGFYSSGHPEPGSNLKNPLGIVKSTDEGKTITKLGLEGETDFHGMAVSYKKHTIYVFNPAPNSKMPAAGLYYSKDEAKTWVKSDINGLEGQAASISVHPVQDNVVAVGTSKGVYISRDYGKNFEKLMLDQEATSLHFTNEGRLYAGGLNQQPFLQVMNMDTKVQKEINVPKLAGDAIEYIAQNPANPQEVVITTTKKDIYITRDQGTQWTKIADQGKTMSEAG